MSVRTTQTPTEVLGSGDVDARITQIPVEVLGEDSPDVRLTQVPVEVVGEDSPDVRLTQVPVEVVGEGDPTVHVTQYYVEILASMQGAAIEEITVPAANPVQLVLTVVFNTPVNVTGNPCITVQLDSGLVNACYTAGTGTDTLTFVYDLTVGDYSSNGTIVFVSPVDLNGGSIVSVADAVSSDLNFSGLFDTYATAEPFGYGHRFHSYHATGQTNFSIPHDVPLNKWTTTKGIGMRRKYILGAILALDPPVPLPPFCGRMVRFTVGGPNTTTFIVPAGVTSIYAEAIGGGGDGDDAGATVGGQGGGGGGYGAALIACAPGDTFPVVAGGAGVDSTFGSGPLVQGEAGSTPAGGTTNIGDFTDDGEDGAAGTTPDGGDGGASPGGGDGGAGGGANTNGDPGEYPGGGSGGGGASTGLGGTGAAGQVTVTWASPFGLRHIAHQFHNTGQTNYSLMHCTPINDYTTTKGIGMRRKYILGAALATIIPIPPSPPELCGSYHSLTYVGYATLNTTWVVPPGVTTIVVECQGPGGNGTNGNDDSVANWPGGAGGGAGGYARSTLSVIPGGSHNIIIGSGGSGTDTDFDGLVVGDAGVGSTGGTANVGDVTANGQNGLTGTAYPPADGGDGGYSPNGGIGGAGGLGSATVGNNGATGGLGAGGGGGGGGADTGGSGASGGPGWMTIYWPNEFGLRHIAHQTHSTGQTNQSIMHCVPLNQYTTTKGIGMRRKYILNVNPSDLRVTQQYAEVFNVDPPTPEDRATQFYFEVMDQPPAQAGWTSPIFRALSIIAAALSEPEPGPVPYTAPTFLRYVMRGAALAASLPPEPTPGCTSCTGSYRVRATSTYVNGVKVASSQELLGTGPAICHCDGEEYPAQPH